MGTHSNSTMAAITLDHKNEVETPARAGRKEVIEYLRQYSVSVVTLFVYGNPVTSGNRLIKRP